MFDSSSNSDATDIKMDVPVLNGKSFFKMLGLFFSSSKDWRSYYFSISRFSIFSLLLISSIRNQNAHFFHFLKLFLLKMGQRGRGWGYFFACISGNRFRMFCKNLEISIHLLIS